MCHQRKEVLLLRQLRHRRVLLIFQASRCPGGNSSVRSVSQRTRTKFLLPANWILSFRQDFAQDSSPEPRHHCGYKLYFYWKADFMAAKYLPEHSETTLTLNQSHRPFVLVVPKMAGDYSLFSGTPWKWKFKWVKCLVKCTQQLN